MVVYVINRLPSKANDFQTPLKKLANFVPIPSVLSLPPKIFGCVAYVHIPKNQRSKIEPCAVKCVLLGLGMHQKGYKCYDPVSNRWYVTFLESESFFQTTKYHSQVENENERDFWSQPNLNQVRELAENSEGVHGPVRIKELVENYEGVQGPVRVREEVDVVWTEINKEDSEEVIQEDQEPQIQESPEDIPEVCTSHSRYILPSRQNRGKAPKRYIPKDGTSKETEYPIANYVTTKKLPEQMKFFCDTMLILPIPENVNEALKDKKWTKIMDVEMKALYKNNTVFG